MAVSGVIDAIDRVSAPSDGARVWQVLVTPDTPTALPGGDGKPLGTLGFYIDRAADPSPEAWATPPIGRGDRLVLPLARGGQRVRVTRADGSTVIERMRGWAFDPATGLG